MGNVAKVQVGWSGFIGSPGVSTFYIRETEPGGTVELAPLRQFLSAALTGFLPNGVTLTFPTVGDVILDTTGTIVGTWTAAPQAPIIGASIGVFSGTSGAVVTWRTIVLVGGRRVRGRTFLVPLAGTAYASDGTLATNFRDGVLAAAAAVIQDPFAKLGIFHRPVGGAGGVVAAIAAATMTDKAMVLRSRRQ